MSMYIILPVANTEMISAYAIYNFRYAHVIIYISNP